MWYPSGVKFILIRYCYLYTVCLPQLVQEDDYEHNSYQQIHLREWPDEVIIAL